MSNNNSIWFTVDGKGRERWGPKKPLRIEHVGDWFGEFNYLFSGAIQAITGRTLTWESEPLEWKPKTENDEV